MSVELPLPKDSLTTTKSEKPPPIGKKINIGPTFTSSTIPGVVLTCPQPAGLVYISVESIRPWYSARLILSHNWLS